MKVWQDDAKCLGLDPNLFFPVGDGHNTKGVPRAERQRTDQLELDAADFCHGRGNHPGKVCPVIEDCKEYAIVNNEDGVYGGTTTEQRIKLRKRRKISA